MPEDLLSIPLILICLQHTFVIDWQKGALHSPLPPQRPNARTAAPFSRTGRIIITICLHQAAVINIHKVDPSKRLPSLRARALLFFPSPPVRPSGRQRKRRADTTRRQRAAKSIEGDARRWDARRRPYTRLCKGECTYRARNASRKFDAAASTWRTPGYAHGNKSDAY